MRDAFKTRLMRRGIMLASVYFNTGDLGTFLLDKLKGEINKKRKKERKRGNEIRHQGRW